MAWQSTGAQHRPSEVEIVREFLDWQRFFIPIKATGSGIAIKAQGESVNHSFRWVKRSDLMNS